METWQRVLIRRIADEIDAHRAGTQSAQKTLTNARGLFDAAAITDRVEREEFESAWFAVDIEIEAMEPDFPSGTASPLRLSTAWLALRKWSVGRPDGRPGQSTQDRARP